MTLTLTPKTAPIETIETDIPARLDRLPWCRFHWLLVTALGITWILDGLEATIVASINPVLQEPATLGLSAVRLGIIGTAYLAGCVGGALLFGYLTDRLGRKALFTVTLGVYLVGALLTAFAWDFWSFLLFRFITGTAIGGEYSAINSAIDELIPARLRGRVDLAINGTYWLGAILGAGASIFLLNPAFLSVWLGWRIAFGIGGVIGLGMMFARQFVPESPRWLLTHGRNEEAEAIMRQIETHVGDVSTLPEPSGRIRVKAIGPIGFGTIAHTIFVRYRSRAFLGLVLIASQAFFYNGITFSYPLVLTTFFDVPRTQTGGYFIVMAVANLLGPLALGHFFDTLGRRIMISATYTLPGVVILISQYWFLQGQLDAFQQTALWAVTFFFASAAASAGYLTVSEVFPAELRAMAIALFYALGTAIGGLGAPALFGSLIETGSRGALAVGYVIGAAVMILAAGVELWIGVSAERKSLEDVATPLSAERALS
jgi:MFS family permease